LSPVFGTPVCKRWLLPLQGWLFETAKVNGGRFFPLKIFKQFGYPSLAADCTLALSSLMTAVVGVHEKRPALPGSVILSVFCAPLFGFWLMQR